MECQYDSFDEEPFWSSYVGDWNCFSFSWIIVNGISLKLKGMILLGISMHLITVMNNILPGTWKIAPTVQIHKNPNQIGSTLMPISILPILSVD